jgi:CxxC motif-containing protein
MKEMVCIVCPMGCHIQVDIENDYKVTGNQCPRGAKYGKEELTAPTRVITSTVRIEGGLYNRLPVKTTSAIPKGLMWDCIELLNNVTVQSPVKVGDVIIKDILSTGIDLVAARDM